MRHWLVSGQCIVFTLKVKQSQKNSEPGGCVNIYRGGMDFDGPVVLLVV